MSEKPRLLYEASIRRRRFFNRFALAVLLVVVAAAAYLALVEAARRDLAPPLLLNIGQAAAILLAGLMSVRGLYNLIFGLTRADESVRFYDRGLVWTRGNRQYKYKWNQLDTYREGAGGWYAGGRPVLQWGSNRFVMADGQRLRYGHRFGDTRPGSEAVRPSVATITGERMGRMLRAEQPVRLHRRLTVYPTGIETGKHDIHWSEVDIQLDGDKLLIRRLAPDGQFETVSRYARSRVDNVGGFLELAEATLPNYQPERFRNDSA